MIGEQLRQVLAGGCLNRLGSTILERAEYLVVQIHTVCDENNLEFVGTLTRQMGPAPWPA